MALVRGGPVLPHVQAAADAVGEATGARDFGTYEGHDPSRSLALDIFVPVWSNVLGDKIAQFLIENQERFGVWYIIYRRRIWNPLVVDAWRLMKDRGDDTQNHFDHLHVSFVPKPPLSKEVFSVSPSAFRYRYEGLDWLFDGPSGLHSPLGSQAQLDFLDKRKVPALGDLDKSVHDLLGSARRS